MNEGRMVNFIWRRLLELERNSIRESITNYTLYYTMYFCGALSTLTNLAACIDWIWILLHVFIEYESCCVYWLNMNLVACIDWIRILLRALIEYESCCVYWLTMNLVACIDWSVKWSTVFQNITTSKLSCMHGSYVSGPLRLTWHHEYASHHTCSILLVMHRLNP